MIRVITLTILVLCFGCHQDNKVNLLLIGTESIPDFSELRDGMIFGDNQDLMIRSLEPFGVIEVYKNGVKDGMFDTTKNFYMSASIAIIENSCELELRGQATQDLIILHLHGKHPEKMTLLSKHKIDKTDNLKFNINLK